LHVRDIVRHASHCLLRIYRDLLRIHRALLRIYRALTWGILWGMPAIVFCGYTGIFCGYTGLFCGYTGLLREGYCEACQPLSFADIQGFFASSRIYKTLEQIFRALLRIYRALLRIYRALWRMYRVRILRTS